MRTGLVLGKFMPVHTGHIQLVDFAMKQCDLLIVWICVSSKEPIPGELRVKWVNDLFGGFEGIEFKIFEYDESLIPNTSETSVNVSKVWSDLIRLNLPPIDVIITSEKYGDLVAGFLHIEHKYFDVNKLVSATAIRNNPYKYWEFVPHNVKPYYYRKIGILGTESTGKSTLTEKLARYFNADFVPEAARDIVENSNSCDFEDLIEIARKHAESILSKEKNMNRMLFIDTDVTMTKSYSKFLFNQVLVVDEWIMNANKCDLYLYLECDSPFIQDGTRLSGSDRNALDEFHKNELKASDIQYYEIKGNWEIRFNESLKIILEKFRIR
jgi:HTH-type transcriptional regulator, transcriptional repressor of NAD biosynthesis genes